MIIRNMAGRQPRVFPYRQDAASVIYFTVKYMFLQTGGTAVETRTLKKNGASAEIRKNSAMMTNINTMQLQIRTSGCAGLDAGWEAAPISVPFNRLYFIESGTGWLCTDTEQLRLEPGKAYLLPTDLPCGFRCQTPMKKIFFDFNLFLPNHFDLLKGFPRLCEMDVTPELIQRLRARYLGNSFADSLWLQSCICRVLYNFHDKYGFAAASPAQYSPHVASTLAYIRHNLSARLRIDELAERCFISRTTLAEQFHREVGLTLGRYIDLQLISYAQQQLAQSDISVEKLSSDLGFCSQFYFSSCFKKHCHLSPAQYRKRYLNKP